MSSKKTIATSTTSVEEEEIFDNFKIDLADLTPEVREKAKALAREMINKGMAKAQAITKGIQEAETWFLESQG